MNKDETLKFALDVLKNTASWNASQQYTREQKAIKAIEAALEAKDEPVAWFWFDERDGGEWIHIADNQINADKFGNAKVIPLYTTPPQRKPLSEEEIGAILEDVNAYGTRLYTFARAIEAAHGIKGEA